LLNAEGVEILTPATFVKRTIICDNPGEEKGMNYLGVYQGDAMYLYMTQLNAGLLKVGNWFVGNNSTSSLETLKINGIAQKKLSRDLNATLTAFNKEISGNAREVEALISHEIAHSHDEHTPAKTLPGASVLAADQKNRDKLNAKPTITNPEYNALNSETNAIFFEYLPRFSREYMERGKDLKTFIPYVRDIVQHNEGLAGTNLKKFLSRLYTFLKSSSDAQLKTAISRLDGYKTGQLNKVK
jgi:hypothetical protein